MTETEVRSALMHAVKVYAGKRAPREQLKVGKYPVEVTITGRVKRTDLQQTFSGTLDVGEDYQSTSSSHPKFDWLIALLLNHGPASVRTWFFTELPDLFDQGKIADVALAEAEVKAVREILERLRSTKTTTSSGRVTLELDT